MKNTLCECIRGFKYLVVVLVAMVLLVLSLPMIVLSIGALICGDTINSDWFMEHSPFAYFSDFFS